jgi:hypothetical protein
VANLKLQMHDLAGGERLVEAVDRVIVPRGLKSRPTGAIELEPGLDFAVEREVHLRDSSGGLILESEHAGPIEGTAIRVDVDVRSDVRNLWVAAGVRTS